MNLQKMYLEEMKRRQNSVRWASKQVHGLTKNHIIKDEEGLDYMDFEALSEQEMLEYKFQSRSLRDYSLKSQLFQEYIRENSGMEFDTRFLIPTEKLILEVQAEEKAGYLLCDVVNMETKEKFAVIMGQPFSNKIFEGKTPAEIKELYFNMINQAMIKNGFTQEQIDDCVHKIAVTFGGKEKTSSLNK